MKYLYFQDKDFDLESELKSCPPRLIVVDHEHGIGEAYVLAYERALECTGTDMSSHLADLLSSYFAWDINYPKQYQLLGLLQIELLNDKKSPFF